MSDIVKRSPQQDLKASLERMLPAMKDIIPAGSITPERLIKVVLSFGARTPALYNCTIESVQRSVMQAAELGLELGGLMGECYILPFGKEATAIVGYQGLLKLMRQSGEFNSIQAQVVYKGEQFEVDLVANTVVHKRTYNGDEVQNDKDIVAAYCIGKLKDGNTLLEVMSRAQIDAVRKRSKAANNGPWVSDFSEMCRKTVCRRFYKWAPKSSKILNRLQDVLQEQEEKEFQRAKDGTVKVPLAERIASRANAVNEAMTQVIEEIDAETGEVIPAHVGREPGED